MSVPAIPTITSAVNLGSSISVQWSAVSGSTSYTVTLTPTNQTSTVSDSTTSVTFPNTNSGNQLTASVIATNDTGSSAAGTRVVDDIGYGIVFWVDAQDTSTMTFGANRTAMGGVQYPTVTQWRDKSGRGAHMNMFGTNQAPIYVSSFSQSVMNAFFTTPLYAPVAGALYTSMPEFLKPGIVIRGRHSSATDSLEANINSRTTPLTFFTVVRDWNDGCMFGSRDFNDINVHYSTGYHTAHLYPTNASDGGNNFNSNTTWSRKNSVNNRFVINTLYHTQSPNQLRFRLNGQVNPTAVNVTAWANFGTMRIGRNNGETTEGILCEVMIFNRILSTTEMQQVEGYLATKWGIQINLPTTHPYYSIPYTGVPVTSATGLPVVPRTAPVLNNTPTVVLTSIPEDTDEPSGDTIAAVISSLGSNYVPYDSADSKGIAIYSAANTNGTWQISTDSGSTWSSLPTITGTQHYLLSGVTTNKIRFVPSANYNGSASFYFRAWDMTSETSGTTVNISSNGGSTIYSSGTATASLTITSVNDAPIMSGSYTFADVNASSEISTPISIDSILSSFTITDADDTNAQTTAGLAITYADTAIGNWYYTVDNQVTWSAMSTVTASTAIHFSRTGSEFIKFVPSSTTSYGSTSIQIRAWDKTNSGEITNQVGNASSGGGTTAYSVNTFTLNCAVTILPDVPTSVVSHLVGGNILLQWTPPTYTGSSTITSYNVYRVVNGVSTLETTTTIPEATITNNLSVTNTYSFKVAAVSAAGESATTESFDVYYVVSPGQPTNVSVQSQNSQLTVSWTPPSTTGGGTTLSYKIYNADTNAVLATGITGTTATIQGLTNYVPQRIYVVAENDGGLVTSNETPVVGLPFVDTPTLPSDTATAIQDIYTNGGSVNQTIASIIQSVGSVESGGSTSLIQNIVKNVVTQVAGSSPATNIPSVIQTLNTIAEGVTNTGAITTMVTTVVDEIIKNGITQASSSENVVTSIKNTILDTITEIARSSAIGTIKSDAIQTAATTLLQDAGLQTATAVATAIVVSNTDTDFKTDMFGILTQEKPTQIIELSSQLTTDVKNSVSDSNKGSDFTAAQTINVVVPNTTQIINITGADLSTPIYLPLQPDIDYSVVYNGFSVSLKYNSAVEKLYSQSTIKLLNSTLAFGQNLFKILQTGTATLLYIPPPSPPQSISASSGTNQITLTWSAPSTPVSSYKVYRVTGGASTLEKTVSGVTTATINTNLTNGTTYTFRITSVYQGIESSVSDAVTVVYTGTSSSGSGSGSGGNVPCIVKGQRILTPDGYVPIESLKTGDFVLTPDNRSVPVTVYNFTVDQTDEKSAPVRIPAGAFSKSYPPHDIVLSPLHAIKKSANVWEIPYAAMKRHPTIKQDPIGESVTYYHIETPNFFKDLIVVEGSVIEPFGFNYVKQHGYEKVTIYTFSKRLNGYTRFSPSSVQRRERI